MKKTLTAAAVIWLGIVAAIIGVSLPAQATGDGGRKDHKEVVCHEKGNGDYVAIPPAQRSAHIPKHEGDYILIAQWPKGAKWKDLKKALDKECDKPRPTETVTVTRPPVIETETVTPTETTTTTAAPVVETETVTPTETLKVTAAPETTTVTAPPTTNTETVTPTETTTTTASPTTSTATVTASPTTVTVTSPAETTTRSVTVVPGLPGQDVWTTKPAAPVDTDVPSLPSLLARTGLSVWALVVSALLLLIAGTVGYVLYARDKAGR